MNNSEPTKTAPQPIRLADYAEPDYQVKSVELRFELDPSRTIVRSKLEVSRPAGRSANPSPFQLNGEHLELRGVSMDGRPLSDSQYTKSDAELSILAPPNSFVLETEVEIAPDANTALEGLYRSNGVFCTQCEPEGFRRITYFPDRPDIMARYKTTIVAPKESYPVMLSNGNPVRAGELPDGRHFAEWDDPFPKPSYLFALVAGDLAYIEDRFTTMSGREVRLRVYVEHGKEKRAQYAMDSLKRAMKWDEEKFGREYDLDVFNIVAVSDFNMGAMENKGLNIFNDRFILADAETATDMDYYLIESIVAHEYFHNWSGNRVTCRDWFQLSLKEGLTVFRDQEFTADMRGFANKRIDDVNVLRVSQFREDAGPLAHAVRPDSYIEINNFYTATVYQKGAEVIRMLQTLLGRDAFHKGLILYFEKHDGQAATCDDFVAAMEEASGRDLSQFKLWYSQAGTPRIHVAEDFDPRDGTYTLVLTQSCPPTPGQPNKKPLHIPVSLGLLDDNGKSIPLKTESAGPHPISTDGVVELKAEAEKFSFKTASKSKPHLSINRGFSAPVILDYMPDDSERGFLMAHDSDAFNRWAVGYDYATDIILRTLESLGKNSDQAPDAIFMQAIGAIAENRDIEHGLKASLLELPAEDYMSSRMEMEDPIKLHAARNTVRHQIAMEHADTFERLYKELHVNTPYIPDAAGMGRRMLKRTALAYLAAHGTPEKIRLVKNQFDTADNMTERMSALHILNEFDVPERTEALEKMYELFEGDHLVINKWLSVQAASPIPGTLATVKGLMTHPAFDIKNPNKVRAVVGAFANLNPVNFHAEDGSGYAFVADQILALNAINPQVAARLVTPLGRWRRFDAARQRLMKSQLERLVSEPALSRDVYEMAKKSLDV